MGQPSSFDLMDFFEDHPLLSILLAALAAWLIMALLNVFEVSTISRFGMRQYLQNIVSAHGDGESELYESRKVYADVESAKRQGTEGYIDELLAHTVVKTEGRMNFDFMSVVAVAYYKGNEEVTGYIVEGGGSTGYDLFHPDMEDVEECITDAFVARWADDGRVLYASDPVEKQRIADSDAYEVVARQGGRLAYCRREDYAAFSGGLKEALFHARYIFFQNGYYEIFGKMVRGEDFEERCPLLE